VINETDSQPDTKLRPRFLWWRFGFVIVVIAILGYGFCAGLFSDPAPSISQQAIFFSVLILMLIETVQARWYRDDHPWEIDVGEKVLTVIFVCFLIFLVIAVLIFIWSVTDTREATFLTMLVVLCVLVVWALALSGDPKR
jgi:hypothetical protein